MKQEMRKLNRAKYAYSDEEAARLAAQGYVPVGLAAAAPAAAVSDTEDKKMERPAPGAAQKEKKAGQPVTAPPRKDKNTEQPAADGGGNGT